MYHAALNFVGAKISDFVGNYGIPSTHANAPSGFGR